MNKKKLALTLLLSSVSAVVVAGPEGAGNVAQNTDAANVSGSAKEAAASAKDAVREAAKEAGKEAAKEVKDAAKDVVTTPGFLSSAWDAATTNKVAVAALVAVSALVGAIIHAAIAENEPVEETEETE